MSRYPERQLNLPGFVKLSPQWIGLRDVIAHGTLAKIGVAPSVRELAAALVVDETKIRSIVDSMIGGAGRCSVLHRLGAGLVEAASVAGSRARTDHADSSVEADRSRHQALAFDGG